MRKALVIGVSLMTLLMAGACDLSGDDSDGYLEIRLNTDYTDQSIESSSWRDYTFTAGSSLFHIIRVTNLQSDMYWELYDDRDEADLGGEEIIRGDDNFLNTGDEVQTVALTPGRQYWLTVYEAGRAGNSSFDLKIEN